MTDESERVDDLELVDRRIRALEAELAELRITRASITRLRNKTRKVDGANPLGARTIGGAIIQVLQLRGPLDSFRIWDQIKDTYSKDVKIESVRAVLSRRKRDFRHRGKFWELVKNPGAAGTAPGS